MVLIAAAPAPLMPTPVVPAAPTAIEAATDTASMVGEEVAEIKIAPIFVLKALSALLTNASTSLEIKLLATATPIEREPPVVLAAATAIEAAPASALIFEESVAVKVADLASTPVAPSPSTKAFTNVAILLSVTTPEPLPLKPVPPEAATATEPAPTLATIFPSATALTVRSPLALTLEFLT